MSSNVLEVKIKALVEGLAQIKQLSDQLSALTGAASGAVGGLGQQGAEAGKASKENEKLLWQLNKMPEAWQRSGEAAAGAAGGLGEMVPSLGGVTAGMGSMLGAAQGLLGALLTLAGIKLSFDYLKDAADTAARTETLGVTLGVVGRNAGYSQKSLDGYEAELKKLGITSQAAREAMSQMIQAGLPLGPMAGQNASNVSKLARAAQDLAVVTGENSSATFGRLITNIQQMDTMGLRFMGLTVNIAAAQETFARSIGKTADGLSQQQKVQAVNNAVLEESMKLQGAYEASMETVGKKVQSLSRYKEELANAIGQKLLPSYAAVVDVVTKFLAEAEKGVKGFDKFGNASKLYGEGFRSAFQGGADLLLAIGVTLGDVVKGMAPLASSVGELVGLFLTGAGYVITLANAIGLIPAVLGAVSLAVALIRDGFQAVAGVALKMFGSVVQGVAKVMDAASRLAGVFSKDMAGSIKESADSLAGFGEALSGSGDEVLSKFSDGTSQFQKWAAAIVDADQSLKKFGKETSFAEIDSGLASLKRQMAENKVTTVGAETAIAKLSARMQELAADGKVTEKQMAKFNVEVGGIKSEAAKKLGETLKNIGTTTTELESGVGESFGAIAGGVSELNSILGLTGAVFSSAFGKGLDSAKTVQDLGAMSSSVHEYKRGLDEIETSLALARVAGDTAEVTRLTEKQREAQEALSIVTATSASKYDALMEASLKSADSTAELDQVVRGAAKAWSEGMISMSQYMVTLGRVTEARQKLGREMDKPMSAAGLSALGTSLDEMATGISAKGQSIINGIHKIVEEGALEGADLGKAFSRAFKQADSEEVVSELKIKLDSLAKQGKITGSELEGANRAAAESFDRISEATIKAADSLPALERAAAKAYAALEQGTISAAEYAVKMQLIANRNKELDQQGKFAGLQDGLKQVGVSLDGVLTGSSAAADGIRVAFEALANTAGLTGEQTQRALSEIIPKAKTLEDLASVQAGIQSMAASGKLAGVELQDANQKTSISFGQIFDQRLKSAQTRQDFALLAAEVTKAGNSGAISAGQMATALDQVRQKSLGAKEEILRLAQQGTAAIQSQTRVLQAQAGITKSEIGVLNAKNEVFKATLNHQNEGTDLSKAELAVAETRLGVAQAGVGLAQAKAAFEVQSQREQAALADEANAKAAAERDKGNQSLQAAAQAATDKAKSEGIATEKAKEGVAAQERNVAESEKAAAGAEKQAIALGNAARQAEQVSGIVNRTVQTYTAGHAAIAKSYGAIAGGLQGDLADFSTKFSETIQASINKQMEALGRGAIGINDYLMRWNQAFQEASTAAIEYANRIADAEARAGDLARSLQVAQLEAQATAAGVGDINFALDESNAQAAAFEMQIIQAKIQVAETVKAASDAAKSFSNSVAGIELELLDALGQTEEAEARRLEMRKEELAMEHQKLLIQIETARIQATIAGVSTAELDAQASKAEEGYNRALSALDQIASIEAENRRKKKEEETAAEKAKEAEKSRAEQEAKNRAASSGAGSSSGSSREYEAARRDLDSRLAESSAASSRSNLSSVQSTATSSRGASTASGGERTVKVILEAGGRQATVRTTNESELLSVLERARLTSAKG